MMTMTRGDETSFRYFTDLAVLLVVGCGEKASTQLAEVHPKRGDTYHL